MGEWVPETGWAWGVNGTGGRAATWSLDIWKENDRKLGQEGAGREVGKGQKQYLPKEWGHCARQDLSALRTAE